MMIVPNITPQYKNFNTDRRVGFQQNGQKVLGGVGDTVKEGLRKIKKDVDTFVDNSRKNRKILKEDDEFLENLNLGTAPVISS